MGVALSYLPSGESLFTGPIQSFGTLTASSAEGASSIMCAEASSFQLGDYITIGKGLVTEDVVKIIGYTAPNILLITAPNFDHAVGETVYASFRKFWLRVEVPENAVLGVATNLYDIGIRRKYVRKSRL